MCYEVVGYLLEELRDRDNFAAFKADVATTNIFIGSLIFIEELAEKVSFACSMVCMLNGVKADQLADWIKGTSLSG